MSIILTSIEVKKFDFFPLFVLTMSCNLTYNKDRSRNLTSRGWNRWEVGWRS